MKNSTNYFFTLESFDGKNTRYKKYLTLNGIEKRIGEKLPNAFLPINIGSNIVWEGSEQHIKLTIFRNFKG